MAADNPESQEEFKPLNVKDALSYLDKVKAKFVSEPNVYNQFLDIMKEFKSQQIDTPGVIERVSSLFKGHVVLISGFNTFLPPGYRIECNLDEQQRNIITVTTPSGTTCIVDGEPLLLNQPEPPQEKEPIEFNHAITFVNKIKSRFAGQPNVYKRFLEILQSYQKDQKLIEDVYSEVQVLFDDSVELLDEFKQFLPEPKNQKKRSSYIPNLGIAKRTKHHHQSDIQISNVRSGSIDDVQPTFSAEEAEFFEKVKVYIGNKATYNAFLKVLNLFSHQIVDQDVLVNRVESFIGGQPELFEWFKKLVGYDKELEHTPVQRSVRTDQSLDIDFCGPSYRHVSQSWHNPTCSGRDALCWDVLNDSYISHPTWASEDTGFVAAKKNQYEEALHRVEEERYDYDLNIEANLNTIALLEPVAKKISLMSAEEKANFKFSLGQNPSLTIYQRIIKKIYGVEKGLEMIELLNNNPVQTLPIVLKRLKQKDDEWKRAQREWNKIWRQVEQRNYWKSLDYQGILFKAKDLSKFRGLIELAQQKRSELAESNHFQYHFNDMHLFKDVSRLVYFFLTRQPVFDQSECDSIRRFMDAFIPQLFDVSDVEPSVGDIAQDIVVEEADEDEDDDVSSVQSTDTAKSKGTNGVRARRKRGQQQNDDDGLRKDVLTKNLKKTSSDSNSSDDTDESDESEQEDEIQHEFKLEVELGRRRSKRVQKKKIMSIQKTNHQKAAPESSAYKSYNMFGSDDFYCFIQLYQMVYERLAKMKSLDAEFKGEPEKAEEARRGACELGITPRRFKALNMDVKQGYYNILLSLIQNKFDQDIDQQTYEECVRYIFGRDAYLLYTIEKLVLTLLRYAHNITINTQSQDLYKLFQKEHKVEQANQGDAVTYRSRVAGILDSTENTYHFVFKAHRRSLSIRLLGTDTDTQDEQGSDGYDAYVANYIDWANETKDVDQSMLTPRFLNRNLKLEGNQTSQITVRSGMQYKICRDTYHMFYIIGTEDTFVRHCNKPKPLSSQPWHDYVNQSIQDAALLESEAYKSLNQPESSSSS